MSDFERYGDYNEIDEPPTKSKAGLIFKAIIFTLCFAVVGFFIFRLFIFNYYPDELTQIYFTDELKAHYNKTNGNIGALTQELLDSRNFGYDDSKEGNFFAKSFIYIPATEELQITLRYNTSLMDKLRDDYGVNADPDSHDARELFDFRLVGVRASDEIGEDTPAEDVGSVFDSELTAAASDEMLMYRYVKLSFDGVKLDHTDKDNKVNWLRLEIRVRGSENDEPFMILIYYNTEEFPLIPYELSKEERP